MTPARRRHPALARLIDLLFQCQADRKALSYLVQEIHESAEYRKHPHWFLNNEFFSDTHARVTCGKCGLDADANTKPPANGIEIGGELVALNCKDDS